MIISNYPLELCGNINLVLNKKKMKVPLIFQSNNNTLETNFDFYTL